MVQDSKLLATVVTSGPCGVAQGKDGDGVLGGAFHGLTTLGTPDRGASDSLRHWHCEVLNVMAILCQDIV